MIIVTMMATGGCSSRTTIVHLADGRSLKADYVYIDDERAQFRADGWDYNLPAFLIADARVTEPIQIALITISSDTIEGPHGTIASFEDLMDYLDTYASRDHPIILELQEPALWPESRRTEMGTAFGYIDEHPYVGLQGPWPTPKDVESRASSLRGTRRRAI